MPEKQDVKNKSKSTIDKINDSTPATIIKIADPTGVTSYYDVYQAGKKFYNNPNLLNGLGLGIETLGAVPLVGKPFKLLIKGLKAAKVPLKTALTGTYSLTRGLPGLKDALDNTPNKKSGGSLIPKGSGGFALPTKDQVINFYNQYKNNWGDMDLRQLSGLLGNLWVESQFNPNAANGKYQGYAQQDRNSSQYTRNTYGWTPLGQIQGILDYGYGRMPKKYSGTSGYLMGNYLNYHKNNPNYTPADSSDYWRQTFERSSNKIKERRDSANAIYGYLSSYLKSTSQDNPSLHYTTDQLEIKPDALQVQKPIIQQDIQLHNNGGNMLRLVPRGKSGIHIKKKNRGKFTAYCGGNVTDACIQKAKNSGNPTLVKRATFAENARKWNH